MRRWVEGRSSAADTTRTSHESGGRQILKERTVLLIEDSDSQRRMMTDSLEAIGYFVVGATDGEHGLRLLTEARPDIVLLDVVMPGLDGWRTLELIRAVSEVPVIMLTVRDAETDRVRGLLSGADDYVGKPFGRLELGARIEAVLRRATAARVDGLTRLPNHRAFHEHLDSLLHRAAGAEEEITLILFDLDEFKRVNDGEGHPVGDEVLRAVSRVVLRTLRTDEEAFRIGGDEFAVVVRGEHEAGVLLAERLRAALLEHDSGRRLPTVSVGVAAFPVDAWTKDDLVRAADGALYAAKRAGKHRVFSHSHLERSPP